ncbi:MAG TPA: hypothetical protein VGO40_05675 [Longimicrobium sp.]|nr:hypothetical protein [Longimicrobium sp.]
MGTEVRRPAGAIQWTHAAPSVDSGADGAADADLGERFADDGAEALTELVGAMFTTPKELRHLAERELGELFVPVEVLAESAHTAVYTLHPGSLAPLLVHAERARHWFPFRVTRVEAVRIANRGSGDGATADASGERPAAPRPPARPAIDWL